MADNQATVESYLKGLERQFPGIYDAVTMLTRDLYGLIRELNPPTSGITRLPGGVSTVLDAVQNFNATTFPTVLRLSWDILPNAFNYELRYGTVWETAEIILTTSSNVANFDPIERNLTTGNHTFMIKGRDINGLYSPTEASVVVNIPTLGTPVLTGNAVGANALLYWTAPSSTWKIDHYKVYQDSVLIGEITGNFTIQTVATEGTYDFEVKAVDIVGNESPLSAVLSLELESPVDFLLLDEIASTYTGTFTRTKLSNYLGAAGIVGTLVSETWTQHFVNNSWNTPQDQITAGYPVYFQPSESALNGTYVETFDFGSIQTNVRITAILTQLQIVGTTTISTSLEFSDDNITYTSPVSGPSAFADSVRYVRLTVTFDNDTNLSLAFVSDLKVKMDVQLSLDSGGGTATATDSGGTSIAFNFTFRFVDSVTLTTGTLQPVTAIYTAVTTTGFKVLIFDSAGNRITLPFSWKARGAV